MAIVFHQNSCFRNVVTYNHTFKDAVYLLCTVCTMFMPVLSNGATLNSGVALNSHTCSIANSLISIYNSHLARCLCFRSVTENFCSTSQKILNVPMTFNLPFCLNNNFLSKNFDALRWSFDRKLIFPTCPGTCRNMFDLCMSQIVTALTRLYKLLEFGNGTKISDEKWRPVKNKYLENKKW